MDSIVEVTKQRYGDVMRVFGNDYEVLLSMPIQL